MENERVEHDDGSVTIKFNPPLIIDIDGVDVQVFAAHGTAEEMEDWWDECN